MRAPTPKRGELWAVKYSESLERRMGTLSAERMEAVNRAIRVSLDV